MNDSEDRFRIHLNLPDQAGLETSENWEFQIYPNPSEDYFRLKMNNQHSGFRGFLYDLSGKQINLFSIPAGAATHSLGMTDLSPGIYWLSLTETSGEKRRHVKKLTIIRN
jgi:hypothetical protein